VGARILVVEDDGVMAKLVTHALQRQGHQTVHAATATAALEAVGGESFDLVIMDLFLPDGDGLAICGQIRAALNLPVIMISSLEQELGAGVVDAEFGPQMFMSKPFNFAAFCRNVELLLAPGDAPPA
jgi:DNA-binding response OmpR family regulator